MYRHAMVIFEEKAVEKIVGLLDTKDNKFSSLHKASKSTSKRFKSFCAKSKNLSTVCQKYSCTLNIGKLIFEAILALRPKFYNYDDINRPSSMAAEIATIIDELKNMGVILISKNWDKIDHKDLKTKLKPKEQMLRYRHFNRLIERMTKAMPGEGLPEKYKNCNPCRPIECFDRFSSYLNKRPSSCLMNVYMNNGELAVSDPRPVTP